MGKRRKKNLMNLNWLENFKDIFLIFDRNQRLQKSIKYKQFRFNFEDKMDKQKGL